MSFGSTSAGRIRTSALAAQPICYDKTVPEPEYGGGRGVTDVWLKRGEPRNGSVCPCVARGTLCNKLDGTSSRRTFLRSVRARNRDGMRLGPGITIECPVHQFEKLESSDLSPRPRHDRMHRTEHWKYPKRISSTTQGHARRDARDGRVHTRLLGRIDQRHDEMAAGDWGNTGASA